jgi:hypothetical protein
LVAGTTYWLELRPHDVNTGGVGDWWGSSPAVSGTIAENMGAGWSTFTNQPLAAFDVSGHVSTSPVPAPPAVVLVGLGAGCVALKRYVGHRRATA